MTDRGRRLGKGIAIALAVHFGEGCKAAECVDEF